MCIFCPQNSREVLSISWIGKEDSPSHPQADDLPQVQQTQWPVWKLIRSCSIVIGSRSSFFYHPSQQLYCSLTVAWEEKHHELQLVPHHTVPLGILSQDFFLGSGWGQYIMWQSDKLTPPCPWQWIGRRVTSKTPTPYTACPPSPPHCLDSNVSNLHHYPHTPSYLSPCWYPKLYIILYDGRIREAIVTNFLLL